MPNQILAIVLGTWTTKAVHMESRGDSFRLLNYVLHEAPPQQHNPAPEVLSQHLTHIREAIGGKITDTVFVIGMTDSMLRLVELPRLEVSDLRRIVKANSKNYFQQDLSDYIFDCSVLPGEPPKDKEQPKAQKTCNVLAVGAKNQFVANLENAARQAGLTPVQITISQVALINAAAFSMPDVLEKEAVALLDLGFSSSTISILVAGSPVLTRVVGIGGNTLTSSLVESFNITYQVAEGIKSVMPEKVQAKLEATLSGLADELRAAIDYFEHHNDHRINQVYVSGGQARSALIVEILEKQLKIPCRGWDATTGLNVDLPPQKLGQLAKDAPQLTVAIGAATSWFKPKLVNLDLLAEQKEAKELHRKDPVRRGLMVAACLVTMMLLWAGFLRIKVSWTDAEVRKYQPDLTALQSVSQEIAGLSKKAIEIEGRVGTLIDNSTNRFLWAPVLDALQKVSSEDIQITHLSIERNYYGVEAAKSPTKKATMAEKIVMTVTAKNFVGQSAREDFIERMSALPYFRENLRTEEAILLKSRAPRQVDPTDPTKTFNFFTIECVFKEKVVGYD